MEMNYFRNILIVPTGLNKYVDIDMCFFFLATPCLNSINQLVRRGRGRGAGACMCGAIKRLIHLLFCQL